MAYIGLKQLDPILTGSLQVSGSSGVTGSLSITDNISVGQYIYHKDDSNTYLNFTDDRLRFNIGGISYIDLNDAGAAPHDITFNDGGNDVDLVIKGSSNNPLFKTDSSTNRIGTHGKGTPEVAFHIGGSELRVDGNISGSATGTGSFGSVVVANISSSGIVTAEHFYSSDDIETVGTGTVTSGYGVVGYSLLVNNNAHGGGDFRVKSVNNNYHIFSDSNQDKVGIGFSTSPTLLSSLHVGGDITATHVTASGNISASGTIYADNFTSTGTDVAGISFADDLNITGHITSSGDINTTSGRVYEAGTSVIDHATAMAIVFGG